MRCSRPERLTTRSQFIDSRDLAEFMIRLAEKKVTRYVQRHGSREADDDGDVLIRHQGRDDGSDASFTWVPADFLTANGVRGWRHMPIWLPPTAGRRDSCDATTRKQWRRD